MAQTSTLTHGERITQAPQREEAQIAGLLATAGITLNGPNPWDLQVHDQRFFRRVLTKGSLGLGESYMDGWWDVDALDEFFAKAKRAKLHKVAERWDGLGLRLKSRLFNLQTKRLAKDVVKTHFDLGNDLFTAMLDPHMQYTCAYWNGAATLEQAQINKLDLICRKLKLAPGMRILELGCGFGGFARFAASKYGCRVTGYNISAEQLRFAQQLCKGLPVRFELKDYREASLEEGAFDRIVSVGLFEHIGHKNYSNFFELAAAKLAPQGLMMLHTIGGNESCTHTDPWLDRYVYPNGMLPSIGQIGRAIEGIFVVEDWHNLGPHYDKTLMAWRDNFDQAWPSLQSKYGDRFYRMWTYYLLACAGSFRARAQQLWQVVLSKGDIDSYNRVA